MSGPGGPRSNEHDFNRPVCDLVSAKGGLPIIGPRGSRRYTALRTCAWIVCVSLLAACRNDPIPQAPLTRVKAVTTEIVDYAPSVILTGVIAARTQTDL